MNAGRQRNCITAGHRLLVTGDSVQMHPVEWERGSMGHLKDGMRISGVTATGLG